MQSPMALSVGNRLIPGTFLGLSSSSSICLGPELSACRVLGGIHFPSCQLSSSQKNGSPCRDASVICLSLGSREKGFAPAFTDEFRTRTSGDEVRKEILKCYDLVHKLGRGAVYLGSARTKVGHAHYEQAMELGREVALLLNCTSWTGVGPGLMDAVVRGAMEARKPVAGFKIYMEAGEWTNSNTHPYLSSDTYFTCRFFSARKHGLVDAGVRNHKQDRTAFVALPGGVGTLDEIFEILTLIQLGRIGSSHPVPFLVMNYDGFYDNLLKFLDTCGEWGTLSAGELQGLWTICGTNSEALKYLADFYNLK